MKKGDHVFVIILRTGQVPSVEKRTISQIRNAGKDITFTRGLSVRSGLVFKTTEEALVALENELVRFREELAELQLETTQTLAILAEKELPFFDLTDKPFTLKKKIR
jgi:hypothetical protein